jgi:hypothetical protein
LSHKIVLAILHNLYIMSTHLIPEADMIKVYEYRTGRLLAELHSEKRMDRWCEVKGYLPHHKVAGGWVVIK